EAVYSLGYSFYTTGRYADAEKVFRFLVLFDHLEKKYWTGLGAVYQVQKRYGEAITAYGYASFLDLENPKPQYLAAECFAAMGDKDNALSALAALETYCPKGTELGREYLAKAAELKADLEK
ncbi:MAG: SycD/LcrH family type III secretion system chaperone, partial [Victivallales bacterium]|nr:SycD/LcrH family type III secretion system chaperone [Victivallales bacterium]